MGDQPRPGGGSGGGGDGGRGRAVVRKYLRPIAVALIGLAGLAACAAGVKFSIDRSVQDIFGGSRFEATVGDARLRGLKWAQPTTIRGRDITAQDLTQLIGYLKARRTNFFIFPDFTVLYGVVGVPSPQPLLWFHEGLTYTRAGNESLDGWIVASLEKNRVETVVIEEVSFLDTPARLRSFPALGGYIADQFVKREPIGIFSIYEKRALP
jgi:hypothetical protein